MNAKTFVEELLHENEKGLAALENAGSPPAPPPPSAGPGTLLRVALANELSVSELAAFWMPGTDDWELKVVLARQAGDEARHFQLLEKRLNEMGVTLADFQAPPVNPLFEFLRGLPTPEERIAAGLVTLESIAYRVNEDFLHYSRQAGDAATAALYQDFIQPDERHHHEMGRRLLEKRALSEESQARARAAAARTLELSRSLRAAAKRKMGVTCLPGC